MKKFLLSALALLGIVTAAQADDVVETTFNINIPGAANYDANYTFNPIVLTEATTTTNITCSYGLTISIQAVDGYSIKSVKFSADGGEWQDATYYEYYKSYDIDIYTTLPSKLVVDIEAKELDLSSMAQAVVYADDPSQISFYKGYDAVALAAGRNVITWLKDEQAPQCQVRHADYSKELYRVSVNDSVYSENPEWYGYITPEDGDSIVIEALWPQGNVSFSLSNSNPEVPVLDLLTVCTIDDVEQDLSTLTFPMTVPIGSYLHLGFNTTDYEYGDSCSYGGILHYFRPTIGQWMRSDMNMEITARKLQDFSASIHVDEPSRVKVIAGNSSYNTSNALTFDADGNATLAWKSNADGAFCVVANGHNAFTVKQNGEDAELVTGSYGSYYVANPGDVIVITTEAMQPQGSVLFVAYTGDTTFADLYIEPNENYDNKLDLNAADGAQTLVDFYPSDRYFYAYASPNSYAYNTQIWINNTKAAADYGSSYSLLLPNFEGRATNLVNDGDIIRVYAGCSDVASTSMSIDFDAASAEDGFTATFEGFQPIDLSDPIANDDQTLLCNPVAAPSRAKVCLALPEGKAADSYAVTLNDEPVAYDVAAKCYAAEVAPDAHMVVKKVSAIADILQDKDADPTQAPLYNRQGQRVDRATAPAGLYLTRGRKVVIK